MSSRAGVGVIAVGLFGLAAFAYVVGLSGLEPPAAVTSAAAETPPAIPGRVQKGELVMEGIPEIPQEINDKLLQYQNARSASLQSWTPTGGMLIRTRFAETAQLHRVDMPLGARRQLTFF